jgi:SAM-dependent methyltransferase
LLSFYRQHGFPYPILEDVELIRQFAALKNTNVDTIEKDHILRTDNQSGSRITRHFSPHFFEVKSGIDTSWPSLLEAFESDKLLLHTIKNRLGYNYGMTGNMLRQGLANSKIAFKASTFNTVVAKYIYSKYTKENSIIYDYSMGFGQRLTAALSLPYHIKYVGVDVWDKSYESNQKIFAFLNKNVPFLNKEAELYCIGSENYCANEMIGKVNVAFSSPPYYILEHYTDDETQAYASGNYLKFLDWWRATTNNVDRLLAKDGVFIINVNNIVDGFNIGEDMCGIIKEKGYVLEETYRIRLTRNLQFANKTGTHKYEPIYVFRRG